jgi:hypothetical protein
MRCLLFCVIIGTLLAQPPGFAVFQKLLPAGARLIEIADLLAVAGKPRALLLWMLNPIKHVRKPGPSYCGDEVYGSYWEGPTRLSLVDPSESKVINTIEIRFPEEWRPGKKGTFWIPFLVSNFYYHVPHPNSERQGEPKILDLRDLTGEGPKAQFVLFTYEVCGGVSTSVFGYSGKSDRAIQYPVEVGQSNAGSDVEFWVDQVFAVKPVRPGYWKFTWGPGHGVDDMIHEDVRYDPVKGAFVEKRKITKWIPPPPPKS